MNDLYSWLGIKGLRRRTRSEKIRQEAGTRRFCISKFIRKYSILSAVWRWKMEQSQQSANETMLERRPQDTSDTVALRLITTGLPLGSQKPQP